MKIEWTRPQERPYEMELINKEGTDAGRRKYNFNFLFFYLKIFPLLNWMSPISLSKHLIYTTRIANKCL